MAILFDLDGTLVDSLPVIVETSLLTCRELNIEVSEEAIVKQIGLPLILTGETFLGEGKGQLYFDTYQKYFYQALSAGMPVFAGIRELLTDLQKRGEALAVVTSKSRRSAEATLELAELRQFFTVVVTVDDPCGHKPSADPVLYALKLLGAAAADSIFVGDSPYDLLCGKAAGCLTCGVLWGAGKKDALEAANPDFLLQNSEQLAKVLLK